MRVAGESLDVDVEGAAGDHFRCRFEGVDSIESNDPVGMLLFALAEQEHVPPLRRFKFLNWDEEESDQRLAVTCRTFTWQTAGG